MDMPSTNMIYCENLNTFGTIWPVIQRAYINHSTTPSRNEFLNDGASHQLVWKVMANGFIFKSLNDTLL